MEETNMEKVESLSKTLLEKKNNNNVLIQIIDDDKSLVTDLEELLTVPRPHLKTGYNVITSYSMIDGINDANRERPDIIILDLKLPNGSGYDILDQIDITPKTIIITGHGTDESQLEGLRRGVVAFLKKPIPFDQLLRIINETVNCL